MRFRCGDDTNACFVIFVIFVVFVIFGDFVVDFPPRVRAPSVRGGVKWVIDIDPW